MFDTASNGPDSLPTPTAAVHGSHRSSSPGATGRPDPRWRTGNLLPTPTVADSRSSANATAGRTVATTGHAGRTLTDAARLLPTPRASDGEKGCPGQRGSHGDLTLPSAAIQVHTLPTPCARDARGGWRHGDGNPDLGTAVKDRGSPDEARWGAYAAAVTRWEDLLGRPAPEPTQPGRHGKPVLAPAFVEWLMGLPHGWVTALPLPRTAALRGAR